MRMSGAIRSPDRSRCAHSRRSPRSQELRNTCLPSFPHNLTSCATTAHSTHIPTLKAKEEPHKMESGHKWSAEPPTTPGAGATRGAPRNSMNRLAMLGAGLATAASGTCAPFTRHQADSRQSTQSPSRLGCRRSASASMGSSASVSATEARPPSTSSAPRCRIAISNGARNYAIAAQSFIFFIKIHVTQPHLGCP